MSRTFSPLLAPAGQAYEAAKLRWATLADTEGLQRLFREARPEEPEEPERMNDWLEHGGALLLEDRQGRALCAVRWREDEGGWRIDRIVTRPEASGQGFGRWLMTKVESLAIRYNVPWLSIALVDGDEVDYYRRLGYRPVEDGEGLMVRKRVGGTWQMQAPPAQ